MVLAGFLDSFDEHGPGRRPFTSARITASFVMPRVLALA